MTEPSSYATVRPFESDSEANRRHALRGARCEAYRAAVVLAAIALLSSVALWAAKARSRLKAADVGEDAVLLASVVDSALLEERGKFLGELAHRVDAEDQRIEEDQDGALRFGDIIHLKNQAELEEGHVSGLFLDVCGSADTGSAGVVTSLWSDRSRNDSRSAGSSSWRVLSAANASHGEAVRFGDKVKLVNLLDERTGLLSATPLSNESSDDSGWSSCDHSVEVCEAATPGCESAWEIVAAPAETSAAASREESVVCDEEFPENNTYGCDDDGAEWEKLTEVSDDILGAGSCRYFCLVMASHVGPLCCYLKVGMGCYVKPGAGISQGSFKDVGKALSCSRGTSSANRSTSSAGSIVRGGDIIKLATSTPDGGAEYLLPCGEPSTCRPGKHFSFGEAGGSVVGTRLDPAGQDEDRWAVVIKPRPPRKLEVGFIVRAAPDGDKELEEMVRVASVEPLRFVQDDGYPCCEWASLVFMDVAGWWVQYNTTTNEVVGE